MTEPPEPLFRSLHVELEDGGPAAPLSAAKRRAMAQAILAAARAEEPASAAPPRAPATRRRRARAAVLLVAAALVCGGAMASAIVWSSREAPVEEEAPTARPRSPEPPPPRPATDLQPPELQPLEVEPPPVEPEPVAHEEEVAPRPRARSSEPRSSEPRSSEPSTPADGLAAANALRRDRRWSAAERAYLAVARRFPSSEQAYAARLAAADLQLTHTDRPARALASYRAALAARPRGSLAAQARYGVARSLRRLGRARDERRALEAFLAAHPDDLRAASARTRLSALAGN